MALATALLVPPVVSLPRVAPTLSIAPAPATTAVAPLSAPTIAFSSADALQIRLSGTAASGGSGMYSYQWFRSPLAGFVPGGDTALEGATSLALTDSTAQPGVPYFYLLQVNDGLTVTTSNQAMAALAIPTVPIRLAPQSGPVVLGYLGSSTWAIKTASGQEPLMIDQDLHAQFPGGAITTIDGAVSGTGTSDYLPGRPYSNALKAAMQGAAGYKVLRLMIGSNDARAGVPVSTWVSNMQAIINDALAWPVDQIVLEEIGIRLDSGDGTLNRLRQYNAARSSLAGPKVVTGTAMTFENQADHLFTLGPDRIHQTDAGQLDLAANQATELAALFTVPSSAPLVFSAAATDEIGSQISVTLSKPACRPSTGSGGFWLSGTSAGVSSWTVSDSTLTLFLDSRIVRGQSVTLSGAAGTLQDAAGVPMNALVNLAVANNSDVGPIRQGLRVQPN